MANKPGTLQVKVYSAILDRDTAFMGKMSTYCQLEVASQKSQTTVDKGSGKTPHWHGEVKTFQITHLDATLDVSIWNPSKKGEALCSTSFFLDQITMKGVKEVEDL